MTSIPRIHRSLLLAATVVAVALPAGARASHRPIATVPYRAGSAQSWYSQPAPLQLAPPGRRPLPDGPMPSSSHPWTPFSGGSALQPGGGSGCGLASTLVGSWLGGSLAAALAPEPRERRWALPVGAALGGLGGRLVSRC